MLVNRYGNKYFDDEIFIVSFITRCIKYYQYLMVRTDTNVKLDQSE